MREGGPSVRPAVGRPSLFTEDVADAILDLIMLGKSMREICERADMPHRTTVLRWLAGNEDFAARCARAREVQADAMDDLILDAANACDGENYQATRVKISAYQWRAAKLKPKQYGDKVTQEHTGPGGGAITLTWSDGST